ncbi:arrestin-like protein, partial [Leptotrombidium deliense]
ITLFVDKREVIDYLSHIDPIEGVIVFDDEYIKNRIIAQVKVSFRYGKEEDEVMGLHFSKELFLVSQIIYPSNEQSKMSKLQKKLLEKHVGKNAVPFRLQLDSNAPQSVILNSFGEGKQCGIQYTVRVFASHQDDDKPLKMSNIEMSFRKVQWTPVGQGKQPYCVIRKDFLFSPGELELEATLDKPLYFHGENIAVSVSIRNFSKKSVKRINVTVVQNVDVSMFTSGHYNIALTSTDIQEGCPIEPGSSLQKTVILETTPEEYKHRRGVAVEGDILKETLRLASSTLHIEKQKPTEKSTTDTFGIHVSYSVKVKVMLGAVAGELVGELPFLLMSQNSQYSKKQKE